MKPDLLRRLNALRAAKQPVALVTDLSSGQQSLVRRGDPGQPVVVHGDFGLSEDELTGVAAQLEQDRNGVHEAGERSLFVQVFNPPLRLIVVGAVHIAQSLVPMARLAGFAVTVVDPRGAFATSARFPDVALSDAWPDDALTALDLDRRSAVVTLTHDPKLDDPALLVALPSPAFYVGALGSRRTHAKRVTRLSEAGCTAEAIARLHAPVGLDIGALSPAEIAVSVLAQIIAVRRRGRDA